MKNLTLSVILDTLFFGFCAFLIAFTLYGYALPFNLRLIFALCTSSLCTILAFKILKDKESKKLKTKKEKQHFEDVITQLNFMDNLEITTFMKGVFDKAQIECEIVNGYLHFPKEKRIALFKYGFRTVGKSDIVRAYNRLKKGYHAEIYGQDFDAETKRFSTLFKGDIILKDANYLYALLKAYDTFPPIKIVFRKNKPTLAQIKENLLNKNRRKTYLGSYPK